MIRSLFSVLIMILLFPASNVYAQPPGSKYLQGKVANVAVILAHGKDGNPDSNVVGPLRKAINKKLGYHTLSLKMPVLPGKSYDAYAAVFPDAYKTLQTAIEYLEKEKGAERIYVLGYSMGARMTSAFLVEHANPTVVGFIGIGLLQGGGDPLDANKNIRRLQLPILDLYADKTELDLRSAENRQVLVSDKYKQVCIAGAEHSFRGHDSQLEQEIFSWLKDQEQKR